MYTMLLSPFFLHEKAAGCWCRERLGASAADTPPVRVRLLAVLALIISNGKIPSAKEVP